MSLLSEVQLRFSAQRLVELTNPDDGSGSLNLTRLGSAIADAKSEFFRRVGVPFDETDADHISVGVKGVLAYLNEYRGLPRSDVAKTAIEEWRESLKIFARTVDGALKWVTPVTDSTYQPTFPPPDTRPAFDDQRLQDYRLEPRRNSPF